MALAPLVPGARVGAYEVLEQLPDNSGEVYKVSSGEQNRTLALRILPSISEATPDTSERLQRAVTSLSALMHPNISRYEMGSEGETQFLVTDHLEGETLAARLARGPLPLSEGLKAAIEMADALHSAHGAGLLHRGLRPSNVMLTPDGVKLTEFGFELEPPAKDEKPEPSTALRSTVTLPHVPDDVLRYMAPEQISGPSESQQADARSDIFAFGAVVYEMLTGQKAFEGKNRPVLIAAISTLDPDPISKTAPDTPAALDHVVQRCLEKSPDDRWQTVHDLLVQLRWVAGGGELLVAAARARRRRENRLLAAIAAAAFVVAVGLTTLLSANAPTPTESVQFRVPVGGLSQANVAISPDGKLLALVAKPNTGEPAALYVRQVAAPEFQRLTGTEDAAQPFWSPDSRSIAFVASGRLKRVAATGGAPKDLGDAAGFVGGAWGSAGIIAFGSAKGLIRISAEGGKAEPFTKLGPKETGHYWPAFLPDGRRVLFLAWSAEATGRGVYSASLDDADAPAKVLDAESNVQYAEPGYLLFHRATTLFAQRFDASSLKPSGEPVHLADGMAFNATNGRGNFDVSQSGAVVYFQDAGAGGGPTGRGNTNANFQWGWFNRNGSAGPVAGETKVYGDMDLSPDEKLIAVTQSESAGAASDIWVIDWQNAGRSYRLTIDPGDNISPIWEWPKGERIAFTTFRKGNADIYIKNANGAGAETSLLATQANEWIEDWSKDGKYILYKTGPEGSEDLWAMPLEGDKKPFPVVEGAYHKDEPQFSHDGKWIAYTSDESAGVFQVYIVSFPGPNQERQQKIRVSTTGSGQPRWRADGKELFFRADDTGRVKVAAISLKQGQIEAGVPQDLFTPTQTGTFTRDPKQHMSAVSRDGQRFLMRTVPNQATGQGGAGGPGSVPQFAPQVANAAGAGAGANAQAQVSAGLTVIRNWPAAFEKETP